MLRKGRTGRACDVALGLIIVIAVIGAIADPHGAWAITWAAVCVIALIAFVLGVT